MTITSIGLALIAGMLSTASPCVLPLLPIVIATAADQHRLGPAALAAGLAVSFGIIGTFVASLGIATGIDAGLFRMISASMLFAVGLALTSTSIRTRAMAAAEPLSSWIGARSGGISTLGASGQFCLGVMLGALWLPCAGPTLAAAAVLAAKGQSLGEAAVTMGVFGFGAVMPLLILGLMSRKAMAGAGPVLLRLNRLLVPLLGLVLAIMGIGIMTGIDGYIESVLVAAYPKWLSRVVTMY